MDEFVEIRKYLLTLWRWSWLVILLTVIAAAIGYFLSDREERVYEATATLIIGQSIQATDVSTSDISASQRLALTYADIARRQPVLRGVIDTLGLDINERGLRGQISVNLVDGTQLLEVNVEAPSLDEAMSIANEVAEQLIRLSPTSLQNQQADENQQFVRQRLESLQGKIEAGQLRLEELDALMVGSLSAEKVQELQSEINSLESLIAGWENNYTQLLVFVEGDQSANYLAIVEYAQGSTSPIRPRVTFTAAVAGAIGMALSLALIFLIDFLDDRLKTTDDLTQGLGLTLLGTIGRIKGRQRNEKLIAIQDMFSPITESYRMIRSNIQFMSIDRTAKCVMVTSSVPGEGKSTTISNLGVVMAQAGLKTVIVDADLRRPTQHETFDVININGLTDFLFNPEEDISSFLKKTEVENLHVMPSGMLPPNPSELLGSKRMEQILDRLQEIYDMILLDTPPSAVVTDGPVLSTKVDGVVLVVRGSQTQKGVARQAISNLQQAGAKILGVVLNQASGKSSGGYYYKGHYAPASVSPAAMTRSRSQGTPSQSQAKPQRSLLGIFEKKNKSRMTPPPSHDVSPDPDFIPKPRPAQQVTWSTVDLRRLWLIPLVIIILGLLQIPWGTIFHQQLGGRMFLQDTLQNKAWPTAPNWFDIAAVEAKSLTTATAHLEQIEDRSVAVRTLGAVDIVSQDAAEAQQFLEQYLEQTPDDTLAHFLLGESYRRQAEFEKTVEQWEKIGAKASLQYLADGLLEQEANTEALIVLDSIMRLDPLDDAARITASQLWRDRDEPLQALALAQEVIAISPESPAGYRESGKALLALEQYEAAIDLLKQATVIKPADTYWNMIAVGNAYKALERWPEAIEAYQQSVAAKPELYHAYQYLGQLRCQLGQPQEAQAVYEQALEHEVSTQVIENGLEKIIETGECP